MEQGELSGGSVEPPEEEGPCYSRSFSDQLAWRSVACLVTSRADRGDPNEGINRCRRLPVGYRFGAEPVPTIARLLYGWSLVVCWTRGSPCLRLGSTAQT